MVFFSMLQAALSTTLISIALDAVTTIFEELQHPKTLEYQRVQIGECVGHITTGALLGIYKGMVVCAATSAESAIIACQ